MANTVTISVSVSSNRYIKVTGKFNNNHQSWNYNVTAKTTVNGVGSKTHTLRIEAGDSPTWSDTYDVGTSSKARTYTCSVYCDQWGSYPGNTTASKTVTVPASISKPKAPSNVTATRSSDTSIKVSWKNNPTVGSISSNTLQVAVDSGGWSTVSSSIGGSTTSYTYSKSSANHRYRFRVASKNSAGTSGYGTSGYVYTSPATPSALQGVQIGDSVSVVATVSNIKWPDHYEWQYSSNNTNWTNISGQTTSSLNYTTAEKNLYYRVRAIGPTGLASAWTEGIQVASTIQMFINIPDGETAKAMYINVPDGTTNPEFYINI